MTTAKKTLALRRLIHAIDCFREVEGGCKALQSLAESEDSDLYRLCFAGICITYMRPFRRADGLGPLPAEFSRFPAESPHAQTHKDLEEGRDGAIAHFAPGQAARLLSDPAKQEVQKKIQIVMAGGEFGYVSPAVTWSKARLPAIGDLAHYQNERARSEAANLMRHLAKGRKYAAGTYILDETFP